MSKVKIAVSVEADLIKSMDQYISESKFPSRSGTIELALREKLARMDGTRLARESAKLNPAFEKQLAEEGMELEVESWPEY